MQSEKAARAKLFLSFDALKGFDQYLKEKEKIIVDKRELSPDSEYELNWKIQLVETGKMIKIVYYERNQYISLEGMVSDIQFEKRIMKIVDKMIDFNNIVEIDLIDFND